MAHSFWVPNTLIKQVTSSNTLRILYGTKEKHDATFPRTRPATLLPHHSALKASQHRPRHPDSYPCFRPRRPQEDTEEGSDEDMVDDYSDEPTETEEEPTESDVGPRGIHARAGGKASRSLLDAARRTARSFILFSSSLQWSRVTLVGARKPLLG